MPPTYDLNKGKTALRKDGTVRPYTPTVPTPRMPRPAEAASTRPTNTSSLPAKPKKTVAPTPAPQRPRKTSAPPSEPSPPPKQPKQSKRWHGRSRAHVPPAASFRFEEHVRKAIERAAQVKSQTMTAYIAGLVIDDYARLAAGGLVPKL